MLRQLTALAVAVSGTVLIAAQPGQALVVTCDGEAATIVDPGPGRQTIEGTPGRDVIVSSEGGDIIYARGGDDLICLVSEDTGDNNAYVYGQLGDDEVHVANDARAFVIGGYGADRVDATGSFSSTWQKGGPGNDSLRGSPGQDWLSGGDGNDELLADGDAPDGIDGGPGNDHVVTGGDSPDWVTLGPGDDLLEGSNTWLDFRHVKHGVVVDLVAGRAVGEGHDTLSGVVGLHGTEFADRIIGTDEADFIIANGGDDRIEARGGDDMVYPGFGHDVVYAGAGDDHSNHQAYLKDKLHLGPGNDYVTVGYGTDVWGGDGNDRIVVAPHITRASLIAGGPGIDSFRISSRLLGVLINLSTGRARVEDRMIDLSGFENATGTRNADTLIGSALSNLLRGMAGNDTIDGRGGPDTADGGDGVDSCIAELVFSCES